MKYTVVLQFDEEGVTASVPALPGCVSEGDTEAEAMENVRIAVQEYLEALEHRLHGSNVRYVEV